MPLRSHPGFLQAVPACTFSSSWLLQVVTQNIDLAHKPRTVTLHDYIAAGAKAFYCKLLDPTVRFDCLKVQQETCLEEVALQVLAKCLSRVSVGSGLPPDGQVLHSLIQGLCQYLWIGPPEKPRKAECMAESESQWNMASSKLAQLVLGESASGKDTCMDLLHKYIGELQDESRTVLSAETVLSQGSVTLSGILKILEQSRGFLTFINPEMESLLNRRKENYISEQDMVQLLDGTPVGKATAAERKQVPRPHVWAALGCQMGVYLREMTGESCGRLRFQVTMLSGGDRAAGFAEKMFSRKASEQLVVELLRQVLHAQHPVAQDLRQLRLRKRRCRTPAGLPLAWCDVCMHHCWYLCFLPTLSLIPLCKHFQL